MSHAAGADGSPTPRFAAYGATKRGLQQLGKSLAAELKMLGIKNVGVHNLSPGMVTTELLMSGADTPTAKFFINCLGECLLSRTQLPLGPAAAAAGAASHAACSMQHGPGRSSRPRRTSTHHSSCAKRLHFQPKHGLRECAHVTDTQQRPD